ncbi:MAG TPA: hypothetical protein VGM76_09090 [Lacipirellulaceae bacterium]|jgi:hypothetical protein
MSSHSHEPTSWTYQPTLAELNFGGLAARVNTAKPQLGLHEIAVQSQFMPGSLLSLSSGSTAAWPAALADAYVRGGDLVSTYSPASDWPYAPSIYWRAELPESTNGALAAISLLVSIQTNLLDTHPLVCAASQLPADEVLQLTASRSGKLAVAPVNGNQAIHSASSPSGLLWRLPGGQLSYVELAEPNDFRQLAIEQDNGICRAEWELFAEFLEKGVIRRAQIHAAFLPRQRDVELATSLCRGLDSRPLPLTA